MANLCDEIEEFLKRQIAKAEQNMLEIQRASLAERFGCVPSQITYVLETRFSVDKGYLVESRRGGGGFIRIIKITHESAEEVLDFVNLNIGRVLTQDKAKNLVELLVEKNIITPRESDIMLSALDRNTLAIELPERDRLRARLLRSMVYAILRSGR
ncbi:MAG: CtsR family transcriptional regulator [Bacillota bacterium]